MDLTTRIIKKEDRLLSTVRRAAFGAFGEEGLKVIKETLEKAALICKVKNENENRGDVLFIPTVVIRKNYEACLKGLENIAETYRADGKVDTQKAILELIAQFKNLPTPLIPMPPPAPSNSIAEGKAKLKSHSITSENQLVASARRRYKPTSLCLIDDPEVLLKTRQGLGQRKIGNIVNKLSDKIVPEFILARNFLIDNARKHIENKMSDRRISINGKKEKVKTIEE